MLELGVHCYFALVYFGPCEFSFRTHKCETALLQNRCLVLFRSNKNNLKGNLVKEPTDQYFLDRQEELNMASFSICKSSCKTCFSFT